MITSKLKFDIEIRVRVYLDEGGRDERRRWKWGDFNIVCLDAKYITYFTIKKFANWQGKNKIGFQFLEKKKPFGVSPLMR